MSDIDTMNTNPDVWTLALGSSEGTYRQAARESLVAMGREATPILIRLLTHSQARVRWEAALAMKAVSDPASAESLVEAMRDVDGDVRWVAAEALARLGKAGVSPLLESLIVNADSFELRDAAHVAISLLEDAKLKALLASLYRILRDGGSPEVVIGGAGEALARVNAEG